MMHANTDTGISTKMKIASVAIAFSGWVAGPVCIAWALGASPITCLLLMVALCTLNCYLIIKNASMAIGTLGLMLDACLDGDMEKMEAARQTGLENHVDVYRMLGRASDGQKR